ncbi:MAG TPA: sodium/proton-translocating pyrophosphatase, partial [Candidatus Peribacteraceae bacterium]|nr:sodium/proton-translocating pyrophosphatase [Candidatus Peribacteraceae bacterium]
SKAAALTRLDILQPVTIIGLLLGAVLPFLIAAMTMEAVSTMANRLTQDIRKQFRDTKGVLQGTVPADSSRLLAFLSTSAIKKSLLPMLLALTVVLVIGLLLGTQGLGGFLLGAILSGFLISSMMIMSGSMLDHAKRHIEAGDIGGRSSDPHKASLLGDMLGDTLKDVSGPAVMNVVKLVAITALLTGSLYSLSGVL